MRKNQVPGGGAMWAEPLELMELGCEGGTCRVIRQRESQAHGSDVCHSHMCTLNTGKVTVGQVKGTPSAKWRRLDLISREKPNEIWFMKINWGVKWGIKWGRWHAKLLVKYCQCPAEQYVGFETGALGLRLE